MSSRVPVAEVVQLLIDRISQGVYPLGSRLPTSRQLAVDLGVHRNTVSKAYRILAERGILFARQGRGTFLVAMPNSDDHSSLIDQVNDDVVTLVRRARRLGIREDELRRLLDEQVTLTYLRRGRRAAFVECNEDDATSAVHEIEAITGFRLEPLLLSDLVDDPNVVLAGLDVISTSLFHLEEVGDVISRAQPGLELVGVHTEADELALQRIAQIPSGARVGIIVSNADGARRFAAQISTVSNVETQTLVAPADDEIDRLARQVDVLVCSRSQARRLRAFELPIPTIELPFHVSLSSAMRLSGALLSTTYREVAVSAAGSQS